MGSISTEVAMGKGWWRRTKMAEAMNGVEQRGRREERESCINEV